MAESGEGVQAGRALQESVLHSETLPLLSSDFMGSKQGLHASAALSLSGWTWSPRSEVAGAAGSQCGSRRPSRLIRGWVDVGTRKRGWVEGHGHGGSHSGKALGQGGGQPPPEPSCSWRQGVQDLWALLVHLYHLVGDTSPSEPRGRSLNPHQHLPGASPWLLGSWGSCRPPAGCDSCQGTGCQGPGPTMHLALDPKG